MNTFIARHLEIMSLQWHLLLDYWWAYPLILLGLALFLAMGYMLMKITD